MSSKKRLFLIVLSLIVIASVFVVHSIVYSSDEMYFSIEALMNRNQPYLGYSIGNPTTGTNAAKIWNIVKRSGANTDDVLPGDFYCLKADVGFENTNENVRYNIFYDLKEEKDSIIGHDDILKGLLTGTIPTDDGEVGRYEALLALLDMLYLPETSDEGYKEELLSNLRQYIVTEKLEYASYYDLMETYPLTDDDIKAVQQAAIWYFTNYGEQNGKFDKTGNIGWLYYTQNGKNYYDFGSYNSRQYEGATRRDQAEALYNYFIDEAKKGAKNYTGADLNTSSPVTLSSSTLNYEESGENYILGPIHLNEKENNTLIYDIQTTISNENGNISNYKLLDSNKRDVTQTNTVKDLVGQNFYISIPKSEINGSKSNVKVDFDISYEVTTTMVATVNSGDEEQPIGISEKQKMNSQESLNVTIEQKEFDLALRKYITKVNDTELEGTSSRVPNIDKSTLNGGTTASYKHRKDPVLVKTGDIVTYKITVYNEGEKAGRATEIVDQLPTGLEYVRVVSGNFVEGSYNKGANKLTLVRNSNNKSNLPAYTDGNLSSETIEIECRVVAEAGEEDKVLTNVAWISKEVDGETNEEIINEEGKDRDSEPGTTPSVDKDNMEDYKGSSGNEELTNPDYYYKGEQDDDDFEKLVIEKAEGNYSIQLEKVDSEDSSIKLQNVTFDITLPGTQNAVSRTTNANGIIDLGTIDITNTDEKDEITLKEITAPSEYNLITGEITVEVEKQVSNGVYSIKNALITSGNENAEVAFDGNSIKITVKNERIKDFDLALRKYITQVGDTVLSGESSRVPNVDVSTLNGGTTATYKHRKDPVLVETGDLVRYNITVYNEGEKAGRATEIVDQLPTGLEYVRVVSGNFVEGSYDEGTNKLTLVRKSGNEENLPAYTDGNLSSETIEIECRVVAEAGEEDKVLTNVAWISKEVDGETNEEIINEEGKDRDSEPGTTPSVDKDNMEDYKGSSGNEDLTNPDYYYKGEQDDDDFEKLIIEKAEGNYRLQIVKVDKNNTETKLSGAEFKITMPDGSYVEEATGEDGTITTGDVNITTSGIDTIKVEEITAPTGYNKLFNSFEIDVTKGISNGKYVVTNIELKNSEGSGLGSGTVNADYSNNLIKITVPNEKAVGSYKVQIVKVDKDNTETKLLGAEFKITMPDGTETTGSTGEDGTITTGDINITSTGIDTIKVEEITAPAGYNKLFNSFELDVTKEIVSGAYVITDIDLKNSVGTGLEDGRVSASYSNNLITITVPNKKIEGAYSLQLEKVDKDDTTVKLQGAEFSITLPGSSAVRKSTNENGIIDLGTVGITNTEEKDVITIKEITAPSEYNLITGEITVEVEKQVSNGVYSIKNALITSGNENAEVAFDGNSIKITVKNEKIKDFDLALRKYITQVGDTVLSGESSRVPNVDVSTLNGGTTASYKHRKDPVLVKTGNIVTYKITVYNEGEKAGRATEIVDQLPTGLEYVRVVSGNFVEGSYNKGTNKLTLVRKSGNEENLPAYTDGNLSSETIEIECRVVAEAGEEEKILTNVAWISKEVDGETNEEIINEKGKDRDSEPGTTPSVDKDNMEDYKGSSGNNDLTNPDYYYKGEQDDDDFEKLIIEKAEGNYKLQIVKVDSENNGRLEGASFKITIPDGSVKTETTDENGVINLDAINITEAGTDIIKIEEENAPSGYNKLFESFDIEVTKEIVNGVYKVTNVRLNNNQENLDVNYSNGVITVTVPNKRKEGTYTLQIEKVDSKDNSVKLQGAVFDISVNGTQIGEKTTGSDGLSGITTVDITDVNSADKIEIKEINVPVGYKGITGTINIEVTKRESEQGYVIDNINVLNSEGANISLDENTNTIKIVVQNEKKYFDLALRKYITKVNDTELEGISSRVPNIDESTLEKGTTATYKHKKDPVLVKTGDTVTYNITVYNEGEKAGRATEIVDQLPTGLEYVRVVSGNFEEGSYDEGTNKLTLVRKSGNEENLPAYTDGNLSSETIEIECRVVAEAGEEDKVLTNVAWISKEVDGETNEEIINEKGKDRDSEPGTTPSVDKDNMEDYKGSSGNEDLTNPDYYYKGEQDDDDFEKLIIEKAEGNYKLQIVKVDKNNTETKLSGAEFKITMPDGSEIEQATGEDGTITTGDVNITTSGIDTIKVEEITAPTGYNKLFNSFEIDVTKGISNGKYAVTNIELKNSEGSGLGSGTVNANYSNNLITITVPNERKEGTYTLQLEKVDSEDTSIKLQNATFDVMLPGSEIAVPKTTNENGIANLGTVEISDVGTKDIIKIKETMAPNGYNLISEEIVVEVEKQENNGTYSIKNALVTSGNENAEITYDGSSIKITVKDDKIKYFDLSLRKFIIAVSDDENIEEEEYLRNSDGSYTREPVEDTSLLNTTDGNGNIITTAIYNHTKEPVTVKKNDYVVYMLRVYNEGEIAGYAAEIKDHLPEYLEFVDNEFNREYGWEVSEDGRTVTTRYLENSLINGAEQNEEGTYVLSYEDVPIMCKVKDSAVAGENITNIADITEYQNEDKEPVIDRDSEEDNVELPEDSDLPGYKDEETGEYIPGQEDDDDFEKVVIEDDKEFDLALRKFITKVDDEDVTTRIPNLSYDEETGKITYNHTKDPVEVVTDNVVIYTIRIFNEGDINGYASEITDDIPEGLEFIPDNETNINYRWVMYDEEGNVTENVDEANTIRTDYLSKEQEENEGDNLLTAFNPNEEISETNPDYRDVQVAFRVIEPNGSDRIIVNSAQISDDSDENGDEIDDKDSTPDEWIDGEDDQDKEYIKLVYFDLSLRKWVTQAIVIDKDGNNQITETGHQPYDDPEQIVKVDLYRKSINDVTVKFRYKIRVTNEGEIAGYAKEITDYVPEGLRFLPEDNPGWTDEGNNVISTRLLENTLLQPGEYAEVEVVLTWINGEDNMGLKVNTAEISEDDNDYGVPDRDSTPDNQVKGEDDIDDAPVMLSVSTGQVRIYFTLGFVVLITIAGGLILIKKFVL